MSEDLQIVVYPSRTKQILLLIAAAGAVAIGVWFVVDAEPVAERSGWAEPFVRWLGIVCATFFGAALLFFVKRMVDPVPALVIDHEGIIDRTTAISVGRVRWEEIERFDTVISQGMPVLRIFPSDPKAILARQNPLKRLILRVNRGIGGSFIWIPQVGLPMKIEELLELIGEFLE